MSDEKADAPAGQAPAQRAPTEKTAIGTAGSDGVATTVATPEAPSSAQVATTSPADAVATGETASTAPTAPVSGEQQGGEEDEVAEPAVGIPLHLDVVGDLDQLKTRVKAEVKLPVHIAWIVAWMASNLGEVFKMYKRIEQLGGEATFEYNGTVMHHAASYTFVDFIEMATIHAILTDKESRAELMDLVVNLYEEGLLKDESGRPLKETVKLSRAELRRLLEESADNYVRAVETVQGNPVVAHVAIRGLDHSILWMSIVAEVADALSMSIVNGKVGGTTEGVEKPVMVDPDLMLELAKEIKTLLTESLSEPGPTTLAYEKLRMEVHERLAVLGWLPVVIPGKDVTEPAEDNVTSGPAARGSGRNFSRILDWLILRLRAGSSEELVGAQSTA